MVSHPVRMLRGSHADAYAKNVIEKGGKRPSRVEFNERTSKPQERSANEYSTAHNDVTYRNVVILSVHSLIGRRIAVVLH